MSTPAEEFFKNLLGTAYRSQQAINKQRKAQGNSFTPGTITSAPEVDKHLLRLLYLSLTGIFAFIGAEPVKVIFRKNFGRGALHPISLTISCFLFLALGLISATIAITALFGGFDGQKEMPFIQTEGGGLAFMLIAILYIWIASYTYKKGMQDIKESKTNGKPMGYLGDSILLKGLEKEGWSKRKIQWVAEPGLTVAVGICLCLFNVFSGILIIVCGISLWIYMIVDHFFLNGGVGDAMHRMHKQHSTEEEANYVD